MMTWCRPEETLGTDLNNDTPQIGRPMPLETALWLVGIGVVIYFLLTYEPPIIKG